jgi:NADPH:quinone reductase-like Zn-dependent oxidoreductase
MGRLVGAGRRGQAGRARRADASELKREIDSVFPLDDAVAAFARVAERGKHGKVVLQIADD